VTTTRSQQVAARNPPLPHGIFPRKIPPQQRKLVAKLLVMPMVGSESGCKSTIPVVLKVSIPLREHYEMKFCRFGNCAHRSVFYVDEQDNWHTVSPKKRYTSSAIICVIGTISVLAFWVFHIPLALKLWNKELSLVKLIFVTCYPMSYYIIFSTLNKQETFQSGSLPSSQQQPVQRSI
jgi:hypothetical protein